MRCINFQQMISLAGQSLGIGLFFLHALAPFTAHAATNRGAYLMPYTRYEAEQGARGGGSKLVQALNFDQKNTASEASNQRYIALPSNGSYVDFKATTPGQGVTLRFTMPDSANGQGLSGSLQVLVNGQIDQNVPVTSYYAWQYFPQHDPTNIPTTSGKVGMRFDEVRFVLSKKVAAGDVIRIQKANGDAIEYGIDFIEVEPIPAAKPKPAGYVSITDYGAKPNDDKSDLEAMHKAVYAASQAKTGVYLPAGRFIFDDKFVLMTSNIAIKGAGIWYTTFYFSNPKVFKGGIFARASNLEFSDFYMGTINNRRFANPGEYMIYKAFMGTYGNNSKIHDVWAEHFEVGAWIGGYDAPYPVDVTKNLLISRVRFRNNYADGVNFSQGTSNSTVEHSNIRNSGDDGLAIWTSNSPNVQEGVENTFRFTTIEHTFRAGSLAIFGGRDHKAHNLLIKDCMGSSGMRFTTDFPGYTFSQSGLMKFNDIDIQNCGTSNDLWDQTRGAIEFFVPQGVRNMQFDNITITNAQRHGIQLVGNDFSNISFNAITINGTGLDGHTRNQQMDTYGGLGIMAHANSGAASFNNLSIKNSKDQPTLNRNQSFRLTINNGSGDSGSTATSSSSSSGTFSSDNEPTASPLGILATTTTPTPAPTTPITLTPTGSATSSLPGGRGAYMPWVEYQAEDGQTNGKVIGPSRQKWDANHIEAEAIGRKAVRLSSTGHYVSFKTTKPGNGVVVRYSIPDAPQGGGIDATLGLYVNGVRVKSLLLTSRYSWSYKGGLIGDPIVDKPAEQPHTFFDEVRALLPTTIPAGATVMLKRDAQDTAAFYIIDLVDIEPVPAPLPMPAGFTSVTQFGIQPNDGKDHADAMLRAMRSTSKLWFPAGDYQFRKISSNNVGLDNPGIEIRGAGMWYTNLNGPKAMFFCHGASVKCVFGDFAITGESKARAEETEGVQKAFAGPMGMNSLIENVWIERVVGAIWVGNDPPHQTQPTQKLTIRNCRIRNTYADGINFDNGTSNSLVENCHMRNTGDDAAVVWSIKWTDWVKEKGYQMGPNFIKAEALNAPDQGLAVNNIFRNITVQMPWRANCFAAYGGSNNLFENSVCEDVLTYPGILIDNEFSPYPFGPNLTIFRNISLIRAGGPMFLENTANPWKHGALKFYLREGDVNDILVENIDIIDPMYSGIEFRGFGTAYVPPGERFEPGVINDANNAKFKNVTLRNIKITNAGTYGIEVKDGGGKGQVNLECVTINGAAKGDLDNGGAPANFFVVKKIGSLCPSTSTLPVPTPSTSIPSPSTPAPATPTPTPTAPVPTPTPPKPVPTTPTPIPNPSTPGTPVPTPTIPIPTIPVPSTPAPGTPQPTDGKKYFYIQNRWNSAYLFDGGNELKYSTLGSNKALYQWSFEPRGDGYYAIRNRQTKELINTERVLDSVESNNAAPAVGDSLKWRLEKTHDGFFRLKSGWYYNDFMHIEQLKGYVQHGGIYPVWESAQWRISSLETATPTSTPQNITYYYFKNRWNSSYLYDGGDQLKYGNSPNDNPSYQWSFESRGNGYYDIKNRKTGEYINIENRKDYVESNPRHPNADSSKWRIEKAGGPYIRLGNGWQHHEYLHIENLKGYVQHGMMYPVWESAQWQAIKVK